MSAQMAMDFEHPRAEQIHAAEDRANKEIEDWSDLAMLYLRNYCRTTQFVFAEDCTKAAEAYGLIAPSNPRAWGGVYIRAQHQNIIVATGETRKRKNGSPAMIYKSLLFRSPV